MKLARLMAVVDNLTWVRGRHTFKTGMEIRRVRLNQGKTADNILNFTDGNPTDAGFVNGLFTRFPLPLPGAAINIGARSICLISRMSGKSLPI